MALPTIQGALKDGFGATVVGHDMPEPCTFLFLDSCLKRLLWARKEVDLGPHPVIGLIFQVGDVERCPQALGLESLDPFFRVSKQGPCLTAVEVDADDKRLEQLELACKADYLALPDTV